MKPAPFLYVAPDTTEECIELLGEHGDEAKVLAGGQSLMALLNLRMSRPAILIDIGRIASLRKLEERDGVVAVGAFVRQRAIETSPIFVRSLPLLRQAVELIGHPATRARGTIVGSMCHADPAAELPLCAALLEAEFSIVSKRGGRTLPAASFFASSLQTNLEADELVTEVLLPRALPGTGYAFDEVSRRHGDFAIVAAAALVEMEAGRVRSGRVALGGMAPSPVVRDLPDGLIGGGRDREEFARVARDLADELQPDSDLHASDIYRKSTAAVLIERVLAAAARDAGTERN